MRGRRLPDARWQHSADEPVGSTPRSALPSRPTAVRPGSLDCRAREGIAAFRVLSVRRGTQTVHRRWLRDDGGLPRPGRGNPAVQAETRSWPERGALRLDHAETKGGNSDDPGGALARRLTSIMGLAEGHAIRFEDLASGSDQLDQKLKTCTDGRSAASGFEQ